MAAEENTTSEVDGRSIQRAVIDALELAKLQVDVLTRLQDADRRGDGETVTQCHATLDRVMADVARVEQARTGAVADTSGADELACGSCGAMARPNYAAPRLLDYTCVQCGWTTHDPAAQASDKLGKARDAALTIAGRTVTTVESALADIGSWRPRRRAHGVGAIRAARDGLQSALRRVENAEQELVKSGG